MNADIPVWLVWCAGALTIALAIRDPCTVTILNRLQARQAAPASTEAAQPTN